VKVHIEAIKEHTWKELVEQAKRAKKSTKKFDSSVPKNRRGANNKAPDIAQSSQAKKKETLAMKVSAEAPPKPNKSNSNSTPEFKSPQRLILF